MDKPMDENRGRLSYWLFYAQRCVAYAGALRGAWQAICHHAATVGRIIAPARAKWPIDAVCASLETAIVQGYIGMLRSGC